MFRVRLILVNFAVASMMTAIPAPLRAQETDLVYAPDFFAAFAPQNALDMLRQLPGFTLREAAQGRGLGQATGNVVINGQRIAAKSTDLATELSRIPAQNVLEIRVVDGASLNIPGLSGQVANILVESRSQVSGQFSWRPEFRAHTTEPLLTRGDISVTGERGRIGWTVALENASSRSGASGPTLIYGAARDVIETRYDTWSSSYEAPQISARLTYQGERGETGNLSGSYRWGEYGYVLHGSRDRVSEDDVQRRVGGKDYFENYEVSGDYEFGLGVGRLKLIALTRESENPSNQNLLSQFLDGSVEEGYRTFSDYSSGERIGRAEYRFTALGGEWQLSGEGAFNSLDGGTRFATLTATGSYIEIPLPGSDVRVEEDRYEGMISYNRELSQQLSLQLSAGGEYSEIRANGETRAFLRPKGLLAAVWSPNSNTTVNTRLQRRVGQLDFGVFAASVDLGIGQANAANTQLVPEQTWDMEVEGIRRLGAWGVTSLRLYHLSIEDIIDYIPVGATGQAPGNLDEATLSGLEWRGNFTLDPLGLSGARLDLRAQLQDSHVRDPLTGEDRAISSSLMRHYEIAFRHDLSDTEWAWGVNARSTTHAREVRLTEIGRLAEGPVWASAFVEHKDVAGLTVRFTVSNLAGARSVWDRTVYANRRDGPISFYEDRDRSIGPIFTLSVRGRF